MSFEIELVPLICIRCIYLYYYTYIYFLTLYLKHSIKTVEKSLGGAGGGIIVSHCFYWTFTPSCDFSCSCWNCYVSLWVIIYLNNPQNVQYFRETNQSHITRKAAKTFLMQLRAVWFFCEWCGIPHWLCSAHAVSKHESSSFYPSVLTGGIWGGGVLWSHLCFSFFFQYNTCWHLCVFCLICAASPIVLEAENRVLWLDWLQVSFNLLIPILKKHYLTK